jgi:hypothetical protein
MEATEQAVLGLGLVDAEGVEVIEGIAPVELAGVDEAHQEVADLGAPLGFAGKGVLAVEDSHLQRALANVMPRPAPCRVAA